MQATVGALPESLLPVSQQTQALWAPLSLPQPGEARSPCKSVPPITVPPLPCPLSLCTCWLWGLLWVGLACPPQGPNRAWGTGHLPGGQRVVLQLGVQPQPLQSGPPAPSAVPGGAASLGGEMPGPQREPGSALVFSAHLRVRRRGDHSRRTRSEGTSPRAEVKGCPRPLGYAVS